MSWKDEHSFVRKQEVRNLPFFIKFGYNLLNKLTLQLPNRSNEVETMGVGDAFVYEYMYDVTWFDLSHYTLCLPVVSSK